MIDNDNERAYKNTKPGKTPVSHDNARVCTKIHHVYDYDFWAHSLTHIYSKSNMLISILLD
jgi:hypothetical protein